jgi:ADP-ribose pyrophosphatase YjhB (NUDIX family)
LLKIKAQPPIWRLSLYFFISEVMKQTFTIGVFAIIRDEQNRVLLILRNDYDLWNLPGGGLEKGESPWQGVVREVKEETGLNVEIVRLTGVYSKTDKDEIVFSFECKIIDGELTLNEEAKEFQFFSFNELPKNMSQKQVERIEDLLKNEIVTTMKIQSGKSSIELINEAKL